jgi:hypothetical protein
MLRSTGYFIKTKSTKGYTLQHMKHPILLLTFITCIFLLSCNANNKETSSALSDTTSVSGLTGDSVKFVKTAAINFKVKDVEQSIREISNLSRKYGGMLIHKTSSVFKVKEVN